MISERSVYLFIYINTFLTMVSMVIWYFDFFFISFLLRNYAIMFFINYGTKNKKSIKKINVTDDLNFVNNNIHVFTSTFIESLTHSFIKRYTCTNSNNFFWFLYYFFTFQFYNG